MEINYSSFNIHVIKQYESREGQFIFFSKVFMTIIESINLFSILIFPEYTITHHSRNLYQTWYFEI